MCKYRILKLRGKNLNRKKVNKLIEEKNNYVENIKTLIENNIVESKKRNIQNENSKLFTYWNVGKEIVIAEKDDKIKYGNSFIKKLSLELTELYGKGYDYSNLRKMKQFYKVFPNCASVGCNFITWTHSY